MHVVGIDASLTSTGIAILQGDEINTAAIKTDLKGPARLSYLRDCIQQIVANADLVVLENYAYSRPNQAHQIGELGGVLRVMLYESGVKWIEVAPAAVKKFATGKGNAVKEAVAVGVYRHWGKEFKTNDETDAAVLAYIGQAYLGGPERLTAYQAEVIAALGSGKKKTRKKVG